MEEDCLDARINNGVDELGGKFNLAVNDNRVTLDRHYLAGILVNEVLSPGVEHPSGKLAANHLLEGSLADLDFVGKVENLEDILVALETDCAEQGSNG